MVPNDLYLYLPNTRHCCFVSTCAGIVEPWEALFTFSYFFVVVITAYLADKQFFSRKFYRVRRNRRSVRKIKMQKVDEKEVGER